MKKSSSTRGFTLIEILVVVAIIVILTSIILAAVNSARSAARDGQRIADLKNIQLKLEQYRTNIRSYPNDLNLLVTNNYINEEPKDPQTGDPYEYTTGGTCPHNQKSSEYLLKATLENDREGSIEAGGNFTYVICDPYSNPLQ